MPFLFIGIPLLVVVILNILSWSNRWSALWAVMLAAIAQLLLGSWDLYQVLTEGGPITSTFFGLFSVDLLSAVVLWVIGLIVGITVIVAHSTVKSSRFSFGNALLLLMMGMNGVCMVTDVFSLYVFIEVTSAASFLLIAINKKQEALEGAFKYYLMSAIATVMMLLSIVLLFALVGDTSFTAIAEYIGQLHSSEPKSIMLAFVLFAVALFIKSGVVPFHTWVPDAHSSAPSPVSVVLAGVVIKVSGVYALMRVFRDVFLCEPALGNVLAVLGVASIAVGALGALGQTDIKRMLAFSSVSQIGYIVLGVGTGSALGFVGAVLHFVGHATFKSLLFVDAAAILAQTGTRDMNRMGGLAQRMPVTGASSVIGLLSMAGIPPLSGFWSKLLIVLAAWQMSPVLGFCSLCLSVLTLGYFLLLQRKVFFGKVAPGMENVRECGWDLRAVQVLLSGLNVGIGLLFPFLLTFLQGRGML